MMELFFTVSTFVFALWAGIVFGLMAIAIVVYALLYLFAFSIVAFTKIIIRIRLLREK
jgi:hypothetical protein